MLKRIFAALALGVVLGSAQAMTVLPLHLEEIIDAAAVAFQGTCVDNRSERDAATGRVVTYTTFRVEDSLKGAADGLYTIKQVGGALAGEPLRYRVEGVPSFDVGEKYVVFLAGKSNAGFSSPIGLGQGKFDVVADDAGPQVTNGRDFRDMTARIAKDLPAGAKAKLAAGGSVKRLSLDEFKSLVRERAQAAAK